MGKQEKIRPPSAEPQQDSPTPHRVIQGNHGSARALGIDEGLPERASHGDIGGLSSAEGFTNVSAFEQQATMTGALSPFDQQAALNQLQPTPGQLAAMMGALPPDEAALARAQHQEPNQLQQQSAAQAPAKSSREGRREALRRLEAARAAYTSAHEPHRHDDIKRELDAAKEAARELGVYSGR